MGKSLCVYYRGNQCRLQELNRGTVYETHGMLETTALKPGGRVYSSQDVVDNLPKISQPEV